MCEEFFDVRMFGAVMSMRESNAGQVRGPMQLTFARSINPIIPLEQAIMGPAQNDRDVNRDSDDDSATTNYGTMGRKATVPYGLYRAHGFFNPSLAAQTGVDVGDLDLFWEALQMTWDLDRSATQGEMACRGLYIFSHESRLGNAAAQRILGLIKTPVSSARAPRSFEDYAVSSPTDGELEGIPGVTLTTLVE